MKLKSVAIVLAAIGTFCSFCGAQALRVSNENPSGIYKIGETIKWKIASTQPSITTVHYVLKQGGMTVMSQGDAILNGGSATVETKLDKPGTVLAEFTCPGQKDSAGKTISGLGGAVVSPGDIPASSPRPDDFDSFWKSKIDEVSKIDPNAQLTPGQSDVDGIDYSKITLDNINGTHVQGQFAKPDKGERFPAILQVQYAGVYALQKPWVTNYAKMGYIALNVEAHDIPIDQPPAFYDQLKTHELDNYPALGNDDREKSYFLRMFLGDVQACRYLMSRPDWDGKTLVVTGTSQGGMQTFATAGLVPQVTAALVNVPAGCDITGPLLGRQPGWPNWYFATKGKDEKAVIETGKYFDAVNFASNIHCPLLCAVGLIDQTVPAAGAIAAFNQAKGPKQLLVMPRSNHHGDGNAQAAYWTDSNKWFMAIAKGEPIPIKPTTADEK